MKIEDIQREKNKRTEVISGRVKQINKKFFVDNKVDLDLVFDFLRVSFTAQAKRITKLRNLKEVRKNG